MCGRWPKIESRNPDTRGLISSQAAARLSNDEALDLIFVPGFSTSPGVTTVAGRGIGMDVVRTSVRRLTGEVDVHTVPGVGTRFVLRLPLAVVLSEALMVRAGGQTFALLLSAVGRVLEVRDEEIRRIENGETVTLTLHAPFEAAPGTTGGVEVLSGVNEHPWAVGFVVR